MSLPPFTGPTRRCRKGGSGQGEGGNPVTGSEAGLCPCRQTLGQAVEPGWTVKPLLTLPKFKLGLHAPAASAWTPRTGLVSSSQLGQAQLPGGFPWLCVLLLCDGASSSPSASARGPGSRPSGACVVPGMPRARIPHPPCSGLWGPRGSGYCGQCWDSGVSKPGAWLFRVPVVMGAHARRLLGMAVGDTLA